MWTFVLKGVSVFIMHIWQHSARLAWVPGCCPAHIPCVTQSLNDESDLVSRQVKNNNQAHLRKRRERSWSISSRTDKHRRVGQRRVMQVSLVCGHFAEIKYEQLHSTQISTVAWPVQLTPHGVSVIHCLLILCQKAEKGEEVSKFQVIQCPLKWDSRPILHCNRNMFRDLSELVCIQQ